MTSERMSAAQTIGRQRFRAPPRAVAETLLSLSQYSPAPDWPRDCRALADHVAAAGPFAIILFTEPLAPEHWRRRSHTVMRRIELISELDETVCRHFDPEIWRVASIAFAAITESAMGRSAILHDPGELSARFS